MFLSGYTITYCVIGNVDLNSNIDNHSSLCKNTDVVVLWGQQWWIWISLKELWIMLLVFIQHTFVFRLLAFFLFPQCCLWGLRTEPCLVHVKWTTKILNSLLTHNYIWSHWNTFSCCSQMKSMLLFVQTFATCSLSVERSRSCSFITPTCGDETPTPSTRGCPTNTHPHTHTCMHAPTHT